MKPGVRQYQRVWAGALAALACTLLLIGAAHTHKVYDKSAKNVEFGVLKVAHISERELVEDATFTGVERQGNRLYSTYDRAGPRGKKACPT